MNKKIGFVIFGVLLSGSAVLLYTLGSLKSKDGVSALHALTQGDAKPVGDGVASGTADAPPTSAATSDIALTPEQLNSAKSRSAEIGAQLSGLTQELNNHLDDAEERHKIESEYGALTKEYNALAIQIVKASRLVTVTESN